jgi:transposase
VFTPEARARVLARVELGVSFEEAATAAGLKVDTVKGWLARGRREDAGAYADFAAAVAAARAVARARPEPMGTDELERLVSEMARAGSVQAAKLRWEMLRAASAPAASREPAPTARSKIDELAARRRAGEIA